MKLIALGDNCIDLYRNTGEAFPGGNALNAAVCAARLGVSAEYLGALGTDIMAQLICRTLDDRGVCRSGCPVIPGGTTKACCYRVENGERTYLGVLTGPRWTGPLAWTLDCQARLGGADVVISSCNAKMPEHMAAVAALPPLFAYDFGEKEKYRTPAYYDQVCASGLDLCMFSCAPMSEAAFAAFCAPLHQRHVCHVLATMGAAGAMISNGGQIVRSCPTLLVPQDTMGAGDAFLVGMVIAMQKAGWRKGYPLPADALLSALQYAAEVAAQQCMLPGGAGVRVTLAQEDIEAWEAQLNGLEAAAH